jgi:hypothetical protein
MFQEPIKKGNKLILIYKNPPIKNIVDVRIKSIKKLANNTGYIFNIYIAPSNNSDIIRELVAFDKEIMSSIEDNSLKWFDRQFDMTEITELYHKSFCNQTKTIGVILTNKQVKNMMYNNKVFQDIDDIVNILADDNIAKKSFVNITMEYYGLYIYSETTSNKWIIRKIDISNINEDDNNVSTDELIDNFQHRIYNIKKKCNDKIGELSKNIDNIRDNMKTIDELLADLKKSSESTNININYFLNKLNTLILNQEENIK